MMGRLIKWLLGLVLVLVLLVVAAAVILPMVIDPNDYKPQIEATASEKLGREFSISRELNLSVFPWLGIETGGVRVGNAQGFSAQPFAEIEQLDVRVKLMPLLSKQIEVDTLVLNGLRLNLERDAQGRTNWESLAGAQQPDEAKPETQDTAAGGPLAVSVQGIRIEDARIALDDRQAGQTVVLDGVHLVTGALAPGATVPVEAGVTFTSTQPAMTLKADLEAKVGSDAEFAVFRIGGLVLKLDAKGEGLPAEGAALELRADLVADTRAGSLTVEPLSISGPAMSATGRLAVTAMQTDPVVNGHLAIAETNPKTLASMFASPIETTDPTALTRASGALDFSYAGKALKLDPLKIVLDDSQLTGHVHVPDPSGPVVRTRLTLDRIDLDRYMPPAAAEPAAEAAKPADKAAAGDPFAALRTLDFVGEFKIGQLKVANARMSNVTSKVVAKNGILKVDPAAADLYEGKFSGKVTLDASGKKPKLATTQQLTGIQVGPLLADVAGEDRLVGQGEFQADISLTGLSEAEIRRTLNGTSRFAFRDGAVKGVNIAQIIREASRQLGLGGDTAATGTPGQTDFTELSGSLTMTNGVIRNRDLSAKSPLIRVEGKGEVDLPQNTIDYVVVAELVKSLQGQGGAGRDELSGIPIPVRVSGPLTGPSYRPDLEAALSAKAKAQIEEKKQELQKKAEDKVKEKVGDALKGLFK